MQLVPGISSVQTALAAPTPARKPNLWIPDSWRKPDSLRLHPVAASADFCRGAGSLERRGYLSFRSRLWCNGSSSPKHGSRLPRSRVTPAFQIPFHFRADFFGCPLRDHLRVGPKGRSVGRGESEAVAPHNYLDKILMREGKSSQAIARFEEVLRLYPDFPEAEENPRIP